MIIGLSGLKRSGKDTIAAYLVKEHGFERKAFADPLKQSVAALLDIPFHEVDKYKEDSTYITLLSDSREGHAFRDKSFTFREFLQRYGTESHRDIFGGNFWVDLTLPVQGFYAARKIVITDVRFKEEAERIRSLSGYVIRIERDETASLEQDPHRSENYDFPELIDWTMTNNGTIEELFEKMSDLLSKLDAIQR